MAAVAVVVAVWLAARLAFERRWRAIAIDLAWIALPIALAGGIWLLRNWVESGNPFYPVRVAAFGLTIFDAPFDQVRALVGFTLADYLGNGTVLSDFTLGCRVLALLVRRVSDVLVVTRGRTVALGALI